MTRESPSCVQNTLSPEMESVNGDQRLETGSVTVREIAHNLNNQVLVMSFNCEQLMTRLSEGDPNRQFVEAIIKASGRVAELTRQMQPQGSPSQPSGEIPARPHSPAAKTILLVEDEVVIRRFMKSCLVSQGYTILEAGHGPEAIATALRYPDTIHLVITDVRLPEMDGFEVVDALRQQRPELPALFISGNSLSDHEVGLPHSNCAYLWKPFKSSELLQKARTALDGQLQTHK